MTSSSFSRTVPQGCERYRERARDVVREREKLGGLRGQLLKAQRVNLRAAQVEEALEVALSKAARDLASKLAGGGDVQAREALVRASALDRAYVNDESRLRTGERRPGQQKKTSLSSPPELGEPYFAPFRQRLANMRAAGWCFDESWRAAMRSLPVGKYHGIGRLALEETRDVWARAYHHAPAAADDRAVQRLGQLDPEWCDVPRHQQVA